MTFEWPPVSSIWTGDSGKLEQVWMVSDRERKVLGVEVRGVVLLAEWCFSWSGVSAALRPRALDDLEVQHPMLDMNCRS